MFKAKLGFAHARPSRDDDQVALVEAVGHAVEVGEAGGDADERAARSLLEILHCSVEDAAERHEAAGDGFLAETEDRLLGLAERLVGLEAAVERRAGDVAAGLDEPAAQRALLDDLDVGVDAAEVGQVDVEAGEVGEAADGVDLRLLLQPRLERAQVDVGARRLQVEHGAVDALVALEVEVALDEPGGDGGEHLRLEQDAGEHRPLGLLAVRQRARGLQGVENGHGAAGSLAGAQAAAKARKTLLSNVHSWRNRKVNYRDRLRR